jgi:hypothetical protein
LHAAEGRVKCEFGKGNPEPVESSLSLALQ